MCDLVLDMLETKYMKTCAELSGFGFSYYEIQIALSVVANRLFGCSWQIPQESRGRVEFTEDKTEEKQQQFDNNTLPTRKAMRSMLERVEAQSLNLIAQKLIDTNNTDNVVTHATNSSTRKKVGCFAPQGVHINLPYLHSKWAQKQQTMYQKAL